MNSLELNEIVARHFLMFLKHYGIFGLLYKDDTPNNLSYKVMVKPTRYGFKWISDFWLGRGMMIVRGYDKATEKRRLQLSQLWRLYILDRIDTLQLKDISKKILLDIIKRDMKINGWRGLEEIKIGYKNHFGEELILK